jgi:ABC-type multidrug transport system ATPase subunit
LKADRDDAIASDAESGVPATPPGAPPPSSRTEARSDHGSVGAIEPLPPPRHALGDDAVDAADAMPGGGWAGKLGSEHKHLNDAILAHEMVAGPRVIIKDLTYDVPATHPDFVSKDELGAELLRGGSSRDLLADPSTQVVRLLGPINMVIPAGTVNLVWAPRTPAHLTTPHFPDLSGLSLFLDLVAGWGDGERDSGSVRMVMSVDSQCAHPLDRSRRPIPVLRNVGELPPQLTVWEVMETAAAMDPISTNPDVVREQLERVLLVTHMHMCAAVQCRLLTPIQTFRLRLALVMLRRPPLLLIDCSSVDLGSGSQRTLVSTLRALALQGHTVVVALQSAMWSEVAQFDNVMLMETGRSLFYGPPARLRDHFARVMQVDLDPYVNLLEYLSALLCGTTMRRSPSEHSAFLEHFHQLCFDSRLSAQARELAYREFALISTSKARLEWRQRNQRKAGAAAAAASAAVAGAPVGAEPESSVSERSASAAPVDSSLFLRYERDEGSVRADSEFDDAMVENEQQNLPPEERAEAIKAQRSVWANRQRVLRKLAAHRQPLKALTVAWWSAELRDRSSMLWMQTWLVALLAVFAAVVWSRAEDSDTGGVLQPTLSVHSYVFFSALVFAALPLLQLGRLREAADFYGHARRQRQCLGWHVLALHALPVTFLQCAQVVLWALLSFFSADSNHGISQLLFFILVLTLLAAHAHITAVAFAAASSVLRVGEARSRAAFFLFVTASAVLAGFLVSHSLLWEPLQVIAHADAMQFAFTALHENIVQGLPDAATRLSIVQVVAAPGSSRWPPVGGLAALLVVSSLALVVLVEWAGLTPLPGTLASCRPRKRYPYRPPVDPLSTNNVAVPVVRRLLALEELRLRRGEVAAQNAGNAKSGGDGAGSRGGGGGHNSSTSQLSLPEDDGRRGMGSERHLSARSLASSEDLGASGSVRLPDADDEKRFEVEVGAQPQPSAQSRARRPSESDQHFHQQFASAAMQVQERVASALTREEQRQSARGAGGADSARRGAPSQNHHHHHHHHQQQQEQQRVASQQLQPQEQPPYGPPRESPRDEKNAEDETLSPGAQRSSMSSVARPAAPTQRNSVLRMEGDWACVSYQGLRFEVDAKGAGSPPVTLLQASSGVFRPGTLTAVLGQRGSGKTVLLNLLAGRAHLLGSRGALVRGAVLFNGVPVALATEDIVFCRETVNLPEGFTVEQVITRSAKRAGEHDPRKSTRRILHALHLELEAHRVVASLSPGLRRLVHVACALVAPRPFVVLDDCMRGLDAAQRLTLGRHLCRLVRVGYTVVVSMREPHFELFGGPPTVEQGSTGGPQLAGGRCFFDRLMILARGRVIYKGASQDIRSYFAERLGIACPESEDPVAYAYDSVLLSEEEVSKAVLDSASSVASSPRLSPSEAPLIDMGGDPDLRQQLRGELGVLGGVGAMAGARNDASSGGRGGRGASSRKAEEAAKRALTMEHVQREYDSFLDQAMRILEESRMFKAESGLARDIENGKVIVGVSEAWRVRKARRASDHEIRSNFSCCAAWCSDWCGLLAGYDSEDEPDEEGAPQEPLSGPQQFVDHVAALWFDMWYTPCSLVQLVCVSLSLAAFMALAWSDPHSRLGGSAVETQDEFTSGFLYAQFALLPALTALLAPVLATHRERFLTAHRENLFVDMRRLAVGWSLLPFMGAQLVAHVGVALFLAALSTWPFFTVRFDPAEPAPFFLFAAAHALCVFFSLSLLHLLVWVTPYTTGGAGPRLCGEPGTEQVGAGVVGATGGEAKQTAARAASSDAAAAWHLVLVLLAGVFSTLWFPVDAAPEWLRFPFFLSFVQYAVTAVEVRASSAADLPAWLFDSPWSALALIAAGALLLVLMTTLVVRLQCRRALHSQPLHLTELSHGSAMLSRWVDRNRADAH